MSCVLVDVMPMEKKLMNMLSQHNGFLINWKPIYSLLEYDRFVSEGVRISLLVRIN